MLKEVPNGDNDQLVLRSNEKWLGVSVGLVMLAVGLGIVIYQFSGITIFVLVLAASIAFYFLFGMPALKVWTFDRTANTVRYEREAAYGSPRTSTHAFSDIVDIRLSSPMPDWAKVVLLLSMQPVPESNLVLKVRQGERITKYVMTTNSNRKDLELLMKQIKEFVGEGKPKND